MFFFLKFIEIFSMQSVITFNLCHCFLVCSQLFTSYRSQSYVEMRHNISMVSRMFTRLTVIECTPVYTSCVNCKTAFGVITCNLWDAADGQTKHYIPIMTLFIFRSKIVDAIKVSMQLLIILRKVFGFMSMLCLKKNLIQVPGL